ncbi:MAG: outer membrane protein assembly factor BamA [Treponema sp.]|jgi:outer membrane protein insertion porin family|nr:outer membrane protein assembly factor BamA [Treponema sp.]
MRTFFTVILFGCVSFFCFSQQADWYRGKPIKDVVFDGLNHVRNSELESTIESFRGKPFSDEIFLDLQSRLYALDLFETIVPTALPADSLGNEVIIQFKVVELPLVSRITFTGNSGVKRRELMEAISLKVNDVANQMLIRADEQAVKNKYTEKGFPDAGVRSELRKARNDTVELVFHIVEGERTVVTAVFFEGNSVYSSSTLRGRLSMKPKGIGRDGSFQEARLLADREALTRYYQDRGYLDAEVTDVVQELVKDEDGNNSMTITYRVYEGRTYTFTGISFEGNDIFSTEDLQKLLRSTPGELANASRVEADLQRVADLYYENGYIFNTISQEELRNPEEGTIAFKISIVERGRAHIENVVIRGNEKTKDFVILREIPLETGDVFSKTKVMEGIRNLYNLQYFSTIIPDTPPGSTDDLMDLVITVEEQSTTELQFGLTFSGSSDPDDFPISGILNITDRNFLGYGSQVKGELTASPSNQSLSLQYSQRWLKDIPLSWGVDLTLSHATRSTAMNNGITGPIFNGDEDYAFPDGFDSYDDYYNSSKIPDDEFLMEYEQWYISLGLSSTYRWSTPLGVLGTGGGIRTGLINNSFDDLLRPFDPVIRERNGKWTPLNSLWTILYLDRRDLVYDPSSGYYASQRFGFYGLFPVEQEHYIKSDTKAEYFLTLFNIPVTDKWSFKTVLALHSGLSFILPQFGMDKPVVEETNKLSIDGMFIGRGWYNERINSRGYALWENWVELRIPLVPNLLAFDWFFDADVAKKTPEDFFSRLTIEDWRFSLGGGLRFTIPQFPFRFLVAKRFKVVDGKVEWQSGNMFRDPGDPRSGLDFIISFALTTY